MFSEFDNIANLTVGNEQHSFEELYEWILERKRKQFVSIKLDTLANCSPWYYDQDEGTIRNTRGSFFRIAGLRGEYPDGSYLEQPIIVQKEIGFLGIICKKIKGTWHFLMQAKIEPGNINYVQISPTIQATKSNFTRQHGGKEPPYLSYFTHMDPKDILVDQIQSEQSSRFWGKRNRNVIVKTDDDIEETDSHKWMTLNQLRMFMMMDNFINMDTRTVLSCIPYVFMTDTLVGYSPSFIDSIRKINREAVIDIYTRENDYKMFHAPQISFVPLAELSEWEMLDREMIHKERFPFKVVYCNLQIEGREVSKWNQPLFAALGDATFGLICSKSSGVLEVLVQMKPEIGCFDFIELGPSVQEEYMSISKRDCVAEKFFTAIENKDNIVIDVMLSEEGGRFYREQNRNVIVQVNKEEIKYDADRYVWVSIGTLNAMNQINNCLNIQLRNLLMLLSMYCK